MPNVRKKKKTTSIAIFLNLSPFISQTGIQKYVQVLNDRQSFCKSFFNFTYVIIIYRVFHSAFDGFISWDSTASLEKSVILFRFEI